MNRNIVRSMFAVGAVLMLLTIVNTADAQKRREVRGRNLTKAQVKVIIDRVEDRVDFFVKNFDKSLDRSKLDGTRREDALNARAKDLERATDAMRKDFNRRSAWRDSKDEVRKCLNIASDIDGTVRRYRFGTVTEANWARVRFDLNSLADVYNLPKVGSSSYR